MHEMPPVLATIIAAIKSLARSSIQSQSWGHRCDRVDVPIQSLVQTLPRLALVSTAINAPLLDADVHGPYNLRVWNY
jgi:hypothetical protein